MKVRRTSSTAKTDEPKETAVETKASSPEKKTTPVDENKKEVPKPPVAPVGGLMGLVAYGSDDDD